MKKETKAKLLEAYKICENEDRSTEYTIQFMMDFANVDHDQKMENFYLLFLLCLMLLLFVIMHYAGKSKPDLFRHLQVGQTECRKRRIWVGRVKLLS